MKKKIALILVAIMMLLPGCGSSGAQGSREILVPDLSPEETEANVETIPGDTAEKPDSSTGGSVRLTYSDQVTVDLTDEVASLYFGNPGQSNQNMILRIVIQDTVIAQSGIIPAGYQVQTLSLISDNAFLLQAGRYSGKFVIYYYDQKTDELATINTEIPITVVVEK